MQQYGLDTDSLLMLIHKMSWNRADHGTFCILFHGITHYEP